MHAYSEDDTRSIESQTVIDDTVVILTTDTQSANDVHSGLTFNSILSFLAVKTLLVACHVTHVIHRRPDRSYDPAQTITC